VICEEARYDSVSILDSTDPDDDLDNDFASVSGGNAVVDIANQEPGRMTLHRCFLSELEAERKCAVWFQAFQYLRFSRTPDPLLDVTGGGSAQQTSPCKDAACLLDTGQLLRGIANAEACEGQPP
jgi:hypothetical protein